MTRPAEVFLDGGAGNDTLVQVDGDVDGGANGWTTLATLQGVTETDLDNNNWAL